MTDKRVTNPVTRRKITIGGLVYNKLLKSYRHDLNDNTLKLIHCDTHINTAKNTNDNTDTILTNRVDMLCLNDNNEENCTICFENLPSKKMSCGHTCCYLCFYKMIHSGGDKCHMCRHALTNDLDFREQLQLKNQTNTTNHNHTHTIVLENARDQEIVNNFLRLINNGFFH